MNLKNLIKLYADKECGKVYVKTLAANDNSKNQVYFGESFDVLNIFPVTDIMADDSGDWKRTKFKNRTRILLAFRRRKSISCFLCAVNSLS